MMGITGAGIQLRMMNMCNGANLAYEKSVFFEVEGFSGIDHLASGDDMMLMQKVAQKISEPARVFKEPGSYGTYGSQKQLEKFHRPTPPLGFQIHQLPGVESYRNTCHGFCFLSQSGLELVAQLSLGAGNDDRFCGPVGGKSRS